MKAYKKSYTIEKLDEKYSLQTKNDTYIATLSHDFTTPISAQLLAIDLLLNKSLGDLNEMQEKVLLQMQESCYYTKNLADNILGGYLYDYGQLKLNLENFDWIKFLDNIVKEFSFLLTDKTLNFINFFDSSHEFVYGDKFQLKRVIMNLLSNALKYSNRNSVIEIFSKNKDGNIILKVKNYSKYISKENLEKIYDKFTTYENKNNSFGLGLYLVKKIIDAHDGYVFANSEKDGECVFGFVIPKNYMK